MKEVETIFTCEIAVFTWEPEDSGLDEIVPEDKRAEFGAAVRDWLDGFVGKIGSNYHVSPPKVQAFVREVQTRAPLRGYHEDTRRHGAAR